MNNKKWTIGLSLLLLTGVVIAGCQSSAGSGAEGSNSNAVKATAAEEGGGQGQAPWIATKNTTRVNSSDPAEAAVLVSRSLWPATAKSNTPGSVVLVDPGNWGIAAASADLVHHPNNGPILFVTKDGLPRVTADELKRLAPTGAESNRGVQAVLVGPVSEAVKVELKQMKLKFDHIQGDEPAAVAEAIDAYYAEAAGELPKSVVVGSLDNPEYTLPAVNWIAHMPEPLLYVTKDAIPAETEKALKKRNGQAHIYLIGPEAAVSKDVESKLENYGKVTRIAGDDVYENAIAFAKFKDPETGFGWGITTPGHNLSFLNKGRPELAIAAAPFSHLGKHAPLIFTDKNKMPGSVMDYVMSIQPKYEDTPAEGPYNHAWLTGNEEDLTYAAQAEIDEMLEIVSAKGEGHGSMGH
ncbi:cell wall-binding repeat-containing protein [Paenibacillus vini]|uniref:ArsR family transcriptional regulator n=1 Tax=Paenibacillus vini TaxID=1476024 RepID=A0ABQ4M902_9BACL|nr:cell wall-binding repeat-containing protein [Paenibacillus vini]GIP52469.1 hypothetical protein J42TS3_15040 [Paenibacillus vini]